MVLKLYGFAKATCTQRVVTVLYELGVPYEFIEVNLMAKEQKTPEYLAHQPFGVVPYINDDGLELYESRAIMRYVALKYGPASQKQGKPQLIPVASDIAATALFEQGSFVEVSNFNPYAEPLVGEIVFKPMMGAGPTNEERVQDLKTAFQPKLDAYEKILSKQRYIAGNNITVADLAHLPYGQLLEDACHLHYLTEGEKRPNLARWWKDISSRAAWQAVKDGVPSRLTGA